MKLKPNYFIFSLTEMKKHCQWYEAEGDGVDWIDALTLTQHLAPISFIHVVDDNDNSQLLASAEWGWDGKEMKFAKVKVEPEYENRGIGTTIMKMVVAIAKFYKASRISGVIDGESRLWDWYAKLGFTIYDQNKLLMVLNEKTMS